MPLITTPGAANANSLITVIEADTLLAPNIQFPTWDVFDDTDKENFLIQAMDYMGCVFRWFGRISSATQRLEFPRDLLVDRNGRCLPVSSIPDAVKFAQALYALQFSLSNSSLFLLESQGAAQIQRVEAGNVEVETGSTQSDFDPILGVKRYPWIEALLISFGATLGQTDLDDRTTCKVF